jgi:hypothetical protein
LILQLTDVVKLDDWVDMGLVSSIVIPVTKRGEVMRIFPVALILMSLGQPAQAAVVYDCMMNVFVSVGEHGLREYQPKRFTMLVTEAEVTLAGDDFITEKADIVGRHSSEENWQARDRNKHKFMNFYQGRLNFVESIHLTRAFNAKCEKF